MHTFSKYNRVEDIANSAGVGLACSIMRVGLMDGIDNHYIVYRNRALYVIEGEMVVNWKCTSTLNDYTTALIQI